MTNNDSPRNLQLEFIKAPAIATRAVDASIRTTVEQILAEVRRDGDGALRRYSKTFDGVDIEHFEVSETERKKAVEDLDKQTRADTEFAIAQVRAFARAQLATIAPLQTELLPGVHLGHRVIPIQKIGAYVPGGRFPLLSAPIMGAARYTGGLWVGSYVKICTHQRLDPEDVARVAPPAVRQSTTEGMDGHRQAAERRLLKVQQSTDFKVRC